MDKQKIKQKLKDFLIKLRALDDQHKKIILWFIVGLLGVVMLIFWFKATIKRIESIDVDLSGFQVNTQSVVGTETSQAWENVTNQMSELATDTANWQTYSNSKYGFEIKIPNNWIVKNSDTGIIFTTQDLLDAQAKNSQNCKNGKECSAEFLAEVTEFNYIKNGANYTSDDIVNGTSQLQLGEITWTKYQPTGLYDNIHFRTISNDSGYDFMTDDENYEYTLEQILSTFKFTK